MKTCSWIVDFIACVCRDLLHWVQNFARLVVRMEQGKQVTKCGFVNLAINRFSSPWMSRLTREESRQTRNPSWITCRWIRASGNFNTWISCLDTRPNGQYFYKMVQSRLFLCPICGLVRILCNEHITRSQTDRSKSASLWLISLSSLVWYDWLIAILDCLVPLDLSLLRIFSIFFFAMTIAESRLRKNITTV